MQQKIAVGRSRRSRTWGGGLGLLGVLFGLASAAVASSEFVPAKTDTWSIPEPDLFAVDVNGDLAWAVGYWGAALRSEDGGRTWAYSDTPTDASLYDVDFADQQHGWAVGAEGALLRTTDGGKTWQAAEATQLDSFDGSERPLTANLFGVAAVSPTEAWAVGDFGVVIHTRDGSRWSPVAIPETAYGDDEIPDRIFNSVVFADRDHGWIGGEFGTTLRTSDGGETWVGQREIRGAIPDIYLFDLAPDGLPDTSAGPPPEASAEDPGTDSPGDVAAPSPDEAATAPAEAMPGTPASPSQPAPSGWALASAVGGVALASSDGGVSWEALDVPTTAGLFGAAVSGERGILVGDRGVLLVTSDGGRTWRVPERPRSFNWLRGAAFDGNGNALAVGESGMILHSSDAGETWERAMGHEPPPTSAVSVPEPPRTKPTRSELDTN